MNKLKNKRNLSAIFFRLEEPTIRQLNDLRTIRVLYGHIRLVIIADSDRQRHVLAAVQAGMHGYIPTLLDPAEFDRAVLTVCKGQVYVPASIANAGIVKEESANKNPEDASKLLSRKQQEVFFLLRSGLTNKEIARKFNVSEAAIKSHNVAIYRKLGALKRADFIHY
ncbi:DNA-binding response regulator [Methylobacterium oxalidis]|uniref:DNA-binding response regulator n=2 Tax=Methylobacterium oxalidis TaxID=944322 RepID=A0A512J9H1_9HYPH|nr:DNA-binding response regulator [Methylobacterium oxalidis]GLS66224.1 DNA-binding response regulator [Methylobacterium oxalidis]